MALSLDQFVQRLTDSGLMSASEAQNLIAALPGDLQKNDAEAFAKKLVADKKLTLYQAQQIWIGKGNGLILGEYVISNKIGAGGMGMVFKAHHRLMKREVALKVLPAAVNKKETAIQRFLREVEAAAKLTHPHIVAAFDAGEANGAFYLIMEYVEGADLSALVKKQGTTTIAQGVDFVLQAARGLEFAHRRGVIHRDIKPANLLLDKSGKVKVLDMGLARIEDDDIDAATQAGLTGTGTIMGTIDYMAPEQAEDTKHAGPPADIYSLGVTLYYLVTGKSTIKGDTLGKKLKMLLNGTGFPQSISAVRSGVSEELDAIFRKMTAFKVADRYQTMTEVIAALEAYQSGSAATAASSPGVQPPAVGRDDDSAMQSFLNKLDARTVVAGLSVKSSPKTEAGTETPAISVDEETRPAFKRVTARTATVARLKRYKLLVGGAAACLLIGTVISILIAGKDADVPKKSGENQPSASRQSLPATDSPVQPESANAPFTAEEAKRYQQAWADFLGEPVETTNSVGMKFVAIPPGRFTMGAGAGEVPVDLAQPFRLGIHEVTQGQFKAVMGTEPWKRKEGVKAGEHIAASHVHWADATEFCRKLTEQERAAGLLSANKAYRLPTEAEWEFACRAGTTTKYSFGDDAAPLAEYAWYIANSKNVGESYAHAVGLKKPNAWGLFDMHGNLYEWCNDWLGGKLPGDTDPKNPDFGSYRVLRGGAWLYEAQNSWSTSRRRYSPDAHSPLIGFRVVLTVDTTKR